MNSALYPEETIEAACEKWDGRYIIKGSREAPLAMHKEEGV